MDEWNITPHFEDLVRQSFGVPEIRTEFVNQLNSDLEKYAHNKTKKASAFPKLSPVWTIVFSLLILLTVSTLVIGPQRVFAAVRGLFGYIPGVGIVDQSAPIRILAEPVSVTRAGITVSVNQAVLTDTETRIGFGISGVPLSAYPHGEKVAGCSDREYLLLPDGTRINPNAPIPTNAKQATFVLPCISNTLPGSVPTNWQIPLRFIPAPPDLVILPVIDVTAPMNPIDDNTVAGSDLQVTETTTLAQAELHVNQIIETEDGYILMGSLRPNIPEGSWLQITGVPTLHDATGKKISYSMPDNVQPIDTGSSGQGGSDWALQIKGAGVKFPLTIGFSGVVISPIDTQASASTTIDVGMNPQPEQVWELNQEIPLAGTTIRLLSVSAFSDGYSFAIETGPTLSSVSVEIEGYPALGGGGGGQPGGGKYSTSLVFAELPKGRLTLLISNPMKVSPTESWQTEWQPQVIRDFPANPQVSNSQICLTDENLSLLQPLPNGLTGKMLLTELNPDPQIVLQNFDGSQRQLLVSGGARGALSADGLQLAYFSAEGLVIQNLASAERLVLAGRQGYGLHWSPDGNQLAYVTNLEFFGIAVTDNLGGNIRQISTLGYESIAGWSTDGMQLYFAVPSATNDGFMLKVSDMTSGQVHDLFLLKDSSRKAPYPTISADGNWIAYRAGDNSSLYLMRMDGSQGHKVIELASSGYAISGIAWGPDENLLGVSLITPEVPNGKIVLLQPDGCEAYVLPALQGILDGMAIP